MFFDALFSRSPVSAGHSRNPQADAPLRLPAVPAACQFVRSGLPSFRPASSLPAILSTATPHLAGTLAFCANQASLFGRPRRHRVEPFRSAVAFGWTRQWGISFHSPIPIGKIAPLRARFCFATPVRSSAARRRLALLLEERKEQARAMRTARQTPCHAAPDSHWPV